MKTLLCTLSLSLLASCSPRSEEIPQICAARAVPGIGGPFTLTDHSGQSVTEKHFAGQTVLVYFGFSWCPDVCPSTLYKVGRALEQVPPSKIPLTMLISVDPERDTPQELASYIRNNGFPANMVGLTGSKEAIAQIAKAFAVGYSRFDDPDSQNGYSVDHSSILYLMDENWQLKTFFTHEAQPALIAQCIRAL